MSFAQARSVDTSIDAPRVAQLETYVRQLEARLQAAELVHPGPTLTEEGSPGGGRIATLESHVC